MKSNMTTNSQLWTTEPKQNKNKNELSKQLEQEQIHRDRVHMKGYQRVCVNACLFDFVVVTFGCKATNCHHL